MTTELANERFAQGIAAAFVGSGVSITTWLRNGSLLLGIAGGIIAIAGALLAYRTKKRQALTAELEARTAELVERKTKLELETAEILNRRARQGDGQAQ